MNQELYEYLTEPPATLLSDLTKEEITATYRAVTINKIPGYILVSYDVADEARLIVCFECDKPFVACDSGATCPECAALEDGEDDDEE